MEHHGRSRMYQNEDNFWARTSKSKLIIFFDKKKTSFDLSRVYSLRNALFRLFRFFQWPVSSKPRRRPCNNARVPRDTHSQMWRFRFRFSFRFETCFLPSGQHTYRKGDFFCANKFLLPVRWHLLADQFSLKMGHVSFNC